MAQNIDIINMISGQTPASIDDLSADQRVRLFWIAARELQSLLIHKMITSGFGDWKTESFLGNSRHKITTYSMDFEEVFDPKQAEYSPSTVMTALASHYCRLPDYDLPINGQWLRGTKCLVTRLCVTLEGNYYLEEYFSTVIQGTDEGSLIRQVNAAHYTEIKMFDSADVEKENRLANAFMNRASLLTGSLHGIKSLIESNAELKQRELDRTRDILQSVRNLTTLFGI